MKKFALPLGIPAVLALVLAVMVSLSPAPVEAGGIPAIVDLPAMEVTSCKSLTPIQSSTLESLGMTAALVSDAAMDPDEEDCVQMWRSAQIACDHYGDPSTECTNAKQMAIDICMEMD